MTEDRDELRYLLALTAVSGVGPVTLRRLLAEHGSASALFSRGSGDAALDRQLKAPDWESVDRALQWAEQEGRTILLAADPAYPTRLKNLPDAPAILYLHGDASLLESPQLAVVGSRNPSPIGESTAKEFARHLASVGLTITSGLAMGIDTAAHRGTLGVGQTIAVFGTGTDRIYPASNRDLAHQIVDNGGLLLSEFPPGTTPRPENFPRRNRLIAGLSLGTLVVEAAVRSGSLITARLAGEMGREVFAIPGSIHNPLARGCHRLIREGAKLVETAQDVLEELAPQLEDFLRQPLAGEPSSAETSPQRQEGLPDESYRELLRFIQDAPIHIDQLVEQCGLTAEEVSSMLLLLELQGYVSAVPGGYIRTGEN